MLVLDLDPECKDLRYMDSNVIKQTKHVLLMTPIKKLKISQINVPVKVYINELSHHTYPHWIIQFLSPVRCQ